MPIFVLEWWENGAPKEDSKLLPLPSEGSGVGNALGLAGNHSGKKPFESTGRWRR